MKTLFICFTLVFVFLANTAMMPKEGSIDSILDQLPNDLELDNSIVRSYQMTTDYYNYNLKGEFVDKRRVAGKITYGLEGDSVKWEDVFIAESKDSVAEFPQGVKQDYLQNFKYLQNEKVVSAEFFKDIPQANVLVQNLFWDMLGFDVFAYSYWDFLKLNEEFRAKEINSEVKIAGVGTFENKDIRLTWLGVTEMNSEKCAIIKYSAMNNPVKLELDNLSLSGRSHYWGEIYVSLEDKQIEHAFLAEDVITDMKIKGQPNNIMGYTVRTINLVKD